MPDVSGIPSRDADMSRLRDLQNARTKKPVSHNGKTPLVRKSGYDALDKNSFLKLLVTQLSKQDPTNPMNDREFISQMAQFSSLEQMNNVANSMHKLRNAQANGLIGKMVEGKDFVTEKHLQGIVSSVIYEPNGDVLLKVGGRFTKFDDVTSVTEVSRETLPEARRSALPNVAEGNVPRHPSVAETAAKVYEENQAQKVMPSSATPSATPFLEGDPSRVSVIGEGSGVRAQTKGE